MKEFLRWWEWLLIVLFIILGFVLVVFAPDVTVLVLITLLFFIIAGFFILLEKIIPSKRLKQYLRRISNWFKEIAMMDYS